jgi:hypothetical protein
MSLALEERFKAHFGASPEICADIWQRMDPPSLPEKHKKCEFLLWALFLIRQYPKETVGATFAGGVHEQTWRDHAWFFVDRVSQLEVDVVSPLLACCHLFSLSLVFFLCLTNQSRFRLI